MGRPPLPIGTWGDISVHHEGDGLWRASARYRGRDGRTRVYSRRRRGGKNGSAAKTALREALGSMQAGDRTGTLTPDSRVSDLLAYWMTTWTAAQPRKVNTLRTYTRAVTLATERVGGLRISEATTGALEAAVNGIRKSNGLEVGRQVRGILVQTFADAVRLDLIGANPALGISSQSAPRQQVKALTSAEVARLRDAAREWDATPYTSNRPWGKPGIADSIDVLLGTGLRTGELLALRRGVDIDLTAAPPTLEVTGTIVRDNGTTVRQPMPKSRASERTSYLPRFAAQALARHIDSTDGGEVGAVFPAPMGGWRSPTAYAHNFSKVATIAGLSWATPKTLRKTVATTLGVELGSGQLGHAGTAVTARHYVEQMRIGPVEVMDLMDAFVGEG